jgi:hypothetical protein
MEMKKKYLYWIPRILSIIFILFISIFSFDVFDAGLGFFETILGLFMHLIPSFILLIILLISWKYELVGGIVFFLFGILLFTRALLTALTSSIEWSAFLYSSLLIVAPAFLIGILWILNWKNKKKLKNKK